MKKFFLNVIIVAVILSFTACSKSPAASNEPHSKANLYAKNGIESYEVMSMEIGSSGMDASGQIIKRAEFDRNGNLLKEVHSDINYTTVYTYKDSLLAEAVMTNVDAIVINTMKMSYKNNQTTESNFGENNVPERIRSLYKDKQGRDTLIMYTTADNDFLYKLVNKYDNVGLKESVLYTDTDTTYTKRINDDKGNQIFESSKPDGKLIYRETKTYDAKGNETEFLYEGLMDPQTKDISHHRTTYLDNGLVDTVFYLDSDGNETKREVYTYKKFDNQ